MDQSESLPPRVTCAPRLELIAIPGLPIVGPGDDLPALLGAALDGAGLSLQPGDVLAVTSKIISRAAGRFVDLSIVEPSPRARELAAAAKKDPRLFELVLRESSRVSRVVPGGALVVRHRLGFLCANAGIDASNAAPPSAPAGSGPWVLLLPEDPDGAAESLRAALSPRAGGGPIGVVITDSFGRPFRIATVGTAIGLAGLPALWDQRGHKDLFGRPLEITVTALADQVAAAADLVAGQAGEGRAVVLVRGLGFPASAPGTHRAGALVRPSDEDLYA